MYTLKLPDILNQALFILILSCSVMFLSFSTTYIRFQCNEMGVRVKVFNATFNSISVVWWSVLLLEEYPVKTNDRLQVTDKLYHIMLYHIHLVWVGFELAGLMVIGTDCIMKWKWSSNGIQMSENHIHLPDKITLTCFNLCQIFIMNIMSASPKLLMMNQP